MDRELAETRRGAKLLREREREATRELELARSGADQAARALAATERGLEERLVALYKWNATGGVATLWSAGDFASFARRREGMARIVAQDRTLFARTRASAASSSRASARARRCSSKSPRRGAKRSRARSARASAWSSAATWSGC